MGRNKKIGLDYFPFDIDFFQDIKIRKLIKYQGGKAVTVYALLLCNIYKEGYYMKWDEELPFIVSEQTGFEEAYIQEVIKCCLVVGLLSKELFEKEKILSSKGIQERYKKICSDCRRICEFSEYILISSEEKNIPSEEKSVNSAKSTQIKEKESKGKNNKEKDNKLSSPLTPQGEGGGDFLSSNLSKKDGIPRNFEGLSNYLKRLGISDSEQDQIYKLSNFGAIGNPVWPLVQQCINSIGKSTFDKSRIKMPGRYIISKLKEEQ